MEHVLAIQIDLDQIALAWTLELAEMEAQRIALLVIVNVHLALLEISVNF